MDTVLLPFVLDECSYLSSFELVQMLKETDNYYYLDDINYLTTPPHEQVLCGYFPKTSPIQFFYYAIARKDPENGKLIQPKVIYLNCRDFECLKRFMDLICKQKPPIKRIFINLPYCNDKIMNPNPSKTVYDNLTLLMKKYEDTLKEVETLYDFRFEDSSKLTRNNFDNKYRLTETLGPFPDPAFNVYENEQLLFLYSPNTFSPVQLIYPSSHLPAKERLGMNVLTFSDNVFTESLSPIPVDEMEFLPVDAVEFCLREISSIYLARGYVVKNIAFPTAFENEDICTALGMTKYRQFVTYRTMY